MFCFLDIAYTTIKKYAKTRESNLSEHEQIIKAQLEQWIDDLQKEVDLNSRLEKAFKNDKSHIKSLSQM